MYFQVDFIQLPCNPQSQQQQKIRSSGFSAKLNCGFMQKRQRRKFYTFLDIFLIVAWINV